MEKKNNIYFLGIGGIGMSALARYFLHEGWNVGGYDRAPSDITHRLENEGAKIHYEDDIKLIPDSFLNPSSTTVVYTPAIPADMSEFKMFRATNANLMKRSQMLGILSQGKYTMAVAGTHGKTTTSTLIAWLNNQILGQGSAFLGGISKNFDSNLVLGDGDRLTVEADEYDRSFLRLNPDVAIVTSADADHLDIYGTHEAVKEAFSQFIERINAKGSLIIKHGLDLAIRNTAIDVYKYSYSTPCDFYASNIMLKDGGYYVFDINTPDKVYSACTLGIPGWVNIENAVAAVAAMWCAAKKRNETIDESALKVALLGFKGVRRRFEFYVNQKNAVYMDDYAHHPRELLATITSVKKMFPERHLTAIFQPHLFTRTRDLHTDFARALSEADEVILLPIYPAREEPIEGVTSEIIANLITKPCTISSREDLMKLIESKYTDIVVTFGAGNIDAVCEKLADTIRKKIRS